MKVSQTTLPGVLVLEPQVYGDERGFFLESWNAQTFLSATGAAVGFVQDNHSRSVRGVLRGLHYQLARPQGKLVRVVQGSVWDVAVDLRRSSAYFGRWYGTELSAHNHRQMWIPPGFGHGFLVLSDWADFLYKSTEFWVTDLDRSLCWSDPALAIAWPDCGVPLRLAERDRFAPCLSAAEVFD